MGGAPARDRGVKNRTPSAAYDLGLTEEARGDYKRRLTMMFREGCAIFGSTEAVKLFRDQIRTAPKKRAAGGRPKPPLKRKGGHDPEADRLLLMSWKTFNGSSKQKWAEMALKNHAVKNRGRVRAQKVSPRSLVRRLDRILVREAELRQIGKRKGKA
jgi:hypothetical protein